MKKYSNINYNDINILKNAIIGFEFEFYSDLSYYMLLSKLNTYLKPITVHGFKVYHSSYTPDENNFKIECDFSGGADMIELITGKLHYVDARIILVKVLKFIKENCETTEKSGIHINISFDKEKTNKTLDKLNPYKILLNVDENYIYNLFPNRKDNYYAKSVKNLIPFKNFDYTSTALQKLISNSIELPQTKYYGINIANYNSGRLEFRYVGGENYEDRYSEILELMDYFIILTYNCIDTALDENDIDKLQTYLMKNINAFKNISDYNHFISEFPTIKLQVNKKNDSIIVKSYYTKISEKIYDLISATQNIKDCVLNYNTETNILEIVNATFKCVDDMKDCVFINCSINGGSFENCKFYTCNIKNSHLHNSVFNECNMFNAKIEACLLDDNSIANTCYLFNCKISGVVEGYSVIRSSIITDNADISLDVEVVNDEFYFGTKGHKNEKKIKDEKTELL